MTFWKLLHEADKYNLRSVALQYLLEDNNPSAVWERIKEEFDL